MGSAPRVSVCIPVYNCEKYLGRAIESVLGQTCENFELVVLDNYSTDNTLKVAQAFSDPRLRIITNATNIGAEANFNRALDEARGEYIKILCADDYIYPDCLEKQINALTANPTAVVVCCSRAVLNEQGHKMMTRRFPGRIGLRKGQTIIRKTIRWGTNLLGEPPAILFRADTARKAGKFNGAQPYMIDLDYWVRLLLNGDIVILKETLSVFRVSTESWSAAIGKSQAKQFAAFAKRIRQNRDFGLSWLDCFIGKQIATIYGMIRQMIYWRISFTKNVCH